MRFSDIEQISKVIRASGIGTRVQREAMAQRIYDWFNNHRDRKYEVENQYSSEDQP